MVGEKTSFDSNRSAFFVGFPPGVKSVTIGDGKDQIEVTGDFDPVNLTVLLRKKVGSAEIITVSKDDARREQRTSDRERRPQHHRRSGPRPRS
ncbi:hypothetical protein EUGRSUZ_K01379 [Eucalyptus grandis]|uniref:Uncharacterized protein n=2 Tax=Eucalyptus grandis TaxID=71139 RepID=A0ACC3IT81_EUCGR|nr:hypothetical protein EUGRSUZ_K01379 [Eucalyptus grandis]